MSFVFSIKDGFRQAVESASGGKQTVLYDDLGNPSIMNIIPAFNLEDIDPDLGTGLHPAFRVNGNPKSEIFIGTYQAYVYSGRAYSLPGMVPTVNVKYDEAVSYCTAKGTGWHLMTMHEWAAVMLWCLKNGYQPRGNTNYGRSHEATYETGKRNSTAAPGTNDGSDGKTFTGSGPVSWNHNNTTAGIADLVGNVWEWQHLFKLVDGKIYCPDENNYDMAEADWPDTGARFDATSTTGYAVDNIVLSDEITNYMGTVGDNSNGYYSEHDPWATLAIKETLDPPLILKQIGVSPKKSDGTASSAISIYSATKGAIWVRNYGERFPFRGGDCGHSSDAGLGALLLDAPRVHFSWLVGFRPAFIS